MLTQEDIQGANDDRSRFIVVPEFPSIVPVETSVRVQIVKDARVKK
jgi:hypothetical protein